MAETKLGFRRDIEGMRAVAILLVVAAHAAIPGFGAGFIGVDVFFVISGFLISGLLVREYDATGRLDLLNFYARRMRRLLPALALVLVVSGVAGAMLLAPLEQRGQGEAATSVPLWISNIYFGNHNLGYFDAGVAANLFLHTWSLGVEEQFYLVWPALLLIAYGGWSWQRQQRDHESVANWMLLATVIGLGLSAFLTAVNQTEMFYSLLTRIWEFALGGTAFLVAGTDGTQATRGSRAISAIRAALVQRPVAWAWVGVSLIALGLAIIGPASLFPGWIAALPALGTALVLASGTMPAGTPVARVLALRPFAWLGRLSYGWYLWHWPALVLGRALGLTGVRHGLMLSALSLLAALLTYAAVERPVREWRFLRARPALSLVAGALIMLGLAITAHGWAERTVGWATSGAQRQYLVARNDTPGIYRRGCDQWYFSSRLLPCTFPSDGHQSLLLLGDSVGMQWQPAMQEVFPARFWRTAVLTKSSCPMVDRPIFYARIGREYTECALWRQRAIRFAETIRPDVIVLGSSAEYDLGQRDWVDGSRAVLRRLSAAAGRVVVIAPTPFLSLDPLVCAARDSWRSRFGIRSACITRAETTKPALIAAWLREAAEGLPNVTVVSFNEEICPGGNCPIQVEGVFVYRDSQHLTSTFVEAMSPLVASRMSAAVTKPVSISPAAGDPPGVQ